MNCMGCGQKLHWWQRHDGLYHNICWLAYLKGRHVMEEYVDQELRLWRLPSLSQLYYRSIAEENGDPTDKLSEIERQIADRKPVFVKPTLENGMLSEGSTQASTHQHDRD